MPLIFFHLYPRRNVRFYFIIFRYIVFIETYLFDRLYNSHYSLLLFPFLSTFFKLFNRVFMMRNFMIWARNNLGEHFLTSLYVYHIFGIPPTHH